MSVLAINKKILRQQYAGLLEEITAKSDDDLLPENIKTETTAAGELTLCVNGIYIHSQRDPLREAQRLVQTVDVQSGTVVVLGFGLGYAAQAALTLGRQIIVVEKHKSMLLKAFELRDFSDFLSNNRIIFVVGGTGDGITSALGMCEAGVVSVIRNKALVSLDEQWYRAAEDRIRTWAMRGEVNNATHKRFGKRWARNLSRNMSAIRDCPGVSCLANLANADVPVFLAAAGPSLDKIKPLLRDIYDRCIVVAVDTSYRFFVQNGIQPDFVVVVDPQFWNSRHLDRCVNNNCFNNNNASVTEKQAVLVVESAVYPPVLNLPFKNKFLCGSLFPLGEFIEKQVDPKGRLGAGGSVATTAWDFARSLGGSDIWIAGLDLAYPDLKTHFRGARFEDLANSKSCRFNPAEKWVVNVLRDGFPFKACSGTGGQVLTDRRLSLYAAWFENQFRQHSMIRNYSFSRDGLAVTELRTADTEKFLALPKRREEIDFRINEILIKTENEFNAADEILKRSRRYENAVSALNRDLYNIKSTAVKGAKIARQALESDLSSSQRDTILKELDKQLRRVTDSEVKEVVDFLFPHTQEKSLDGSYKQESSDSFNTYLKSLHAMFTGLSEAADFSLS